MTEIELNKHTIAQRKADVSEGTIAFCKKSVIAALDEKFRSFEYATTAGDTRRAIGTTNPDVLARHNIQPLLQGDPNRIFYFDGDKCAVRSFLVINFLQFIDGDVYEQG